VTDFALTSERLAAVQGFQDLIADPDAREEYASADDKQAVFASRSEANYDELPVQVRTFLEDMTPEQLQLLADLDAAFVTGGLAFPLPADMRTAMVF
jgi:hypothetical protein